MTSCSCSARSPARRRRRRSAPRRTRRRTYRKRRSYSRSYSTPRRKRSSTTMYSRVRKNYARAAKCFRREGDTVKCRSLVDTADIYSAEAARKFTNFAAETQSKYMAKAKENLSSFQTYWAAKQARAAARGGVLSPGGLSSLGVNSSPSTGGGGTGIAPFNLSTDMSTN